MRNWRELDRAVVELFATTMGRADPEMVGEARAELVRRDREYAQQEEQSRREFERDIEKTRTEREMSRQAFDAALAVESREAARQAAQIQSDASKEAAKLQAAATREAAERQVRAGRLAVCVAARNDERSDAQSRAVSDAD